MGRSTMVESSAIALYGIVAIKLHKKKYVLRNTYLHQGSYNLSRFFKIILLNPILRMLQL